jgi:hypothetical protein
MSQAEMSSLFELRRIWEDRYIIGFTVGGSWRAARVGNALKSFTADTPEELRGFIQEDYAIWQQEARRQNS